jgi:hypothetical protein
MYPLTILVIRFSSTYAARCNCSKNWVKSENSEGNFILFNCRWSQFVYPGLLVVTRFVCQKGPLWGHTFRFGGSLLNIPLPEKEKARAAYPTSRAALASAHVQSWQSSRRNGRPTSYCFACASLS